MQVTFSGLALEQARDIVFDTLMPDYWFVQHKGTGKTVVMVHAPAQRAEAIATELSNLRDWQAVDDWSEHDADLVAFAASHLAEVELPEYDDGTQDSVSWPDDFDQVVPYGP
jgi:hypothetical protein